MPAMVELQSLSSTVPAAVYPGSGSGSDIQTGWLSNPNAAGGGTAPGVPGQSPDFIGAPMIVTPLAGGQGAPWAFAEVVSVTRSTIVTPGKAVICIRNISAADETGPITIASNEFAAKTVKYYSRVKVTMNGITVFVGALMKRRELLGGNAILLEYWDDRWLLSKIRLRGCVCLDPDDNTIKLIPGFDPHTNPKGYKNCTRIPATNGTTSEYYVFLAPAEYGTQTLEYDPNTGGEDGAAGVAIDWTPERWIKYLNYITTVFDATAGGTNAYAKTWPQLDTTKLLWPMPTFIDGTMQGKMPDINFKGKTVLQGMQIGFEVSGEYAFSVDYASNSIKYFITTLGTQNANNTGATVGKSLFIQRSGNVADIKSVVDGVAETDASEFVTASLVDGARFRIESQFWYSGAAAGDPDTGFTDSLIPAWSAQEQAGFLKIIDTGKNVVARVGNNGVVSGYDTGTDIPGYTGGAGARTKNALSIARMCFPKVFRAFSIYDVSNTKLNFIMNGFNNALQKYPYLNAYRVAMPDQLQPYFEDATQPTRRGRLRVPIRIQVSDVNLGTAVGSAKFHDVSFNNGLRVTSDGLIWLDGLTDDLSTDDVCYTPNILGYNSSSPTTLPKLRYMKINMAVEHDARLWDHIDMFQSGIDYNGCADQIDASLVGTTGPRLQHYILSEQGYLYESQLKSIPVLPGSFLTTDGGINNAAPTLTPLVTPCNKVLYNNQLNITDHVARSHQRMCRLKKRITLDLPGIRLDLDAGDYIQSVKLIGGAAGDEYKIGDPIDDVHYDVGNQRTRITI